MTGKKIYNYLIDYNFAGGKNMDQPKKIRIEIPIFDNGRQVFDFKVGKPLTWRTK